MTRRERIGAGLILFLLLTVSATPVSAEHQNRFHHWGKHYRPLAAANCGQFEGRLCGWMGEAENLWVSNGFADGFRVNNPDRGCAEVTGWITTCVVPGSAIPGNDGQTFPVYVADPHLHLRAAVIRICGDCGLSESRLRAVVQHEYGHAIGLGHPVPGWGPSVMLTPGAVLGAVTNHDRVDALQNVMYPQYPAWNHDNTMYQGETMYPAGSLLSTIRLSELVMQPTDGNLVVYNRYSNRATWSSGTNQPGSRFQMQGDGNAVLVGPSGLPICSTRTNRPGSWIAMQDDGNLVVYAPFAGAMWDSFSGGQCYPA